MKRIFSKFSNFLKGCDIVKKLKNIKKQLKKVNKNKNGKIDINKISMELSICY